MLTRGHLLALSFLGLGCLWFLLVDWSWFVEGCSDCVYQRDVTQYRIATIPVSKEVGEFPSPVQQVAEDLGKPCPHHGWYSYQKQRWWGLLICGYPNIKGTVRVSTGEPWYVSNLRSAVRAMAAEDASLADEFHDRVIIQHDWDYWKAFIARMTEYATDKDLSQNSVEDERISNHAGDGND